jgi:hypothetical protein
MLRVINSLNTLPPYALVYPYPYIPFHSISLPPLIPLPLFLIEFKPNPFFTQIPPLNS